MASGGPQSDIAQIIVDRGGDYVLSLKENWPATYAEVDTVFSDPASAPMIQHS